jgi:DNA-binding NarL/FixJ family response regulator
MHSIMGVSLQQPKTSTACRVLIVDDHPIVRKGLGQLIDAESDMELVGEADSPDAGLEAIARLHPDVVITDLSFEGIDGIEFIKDIKVRYPELPILVLSMHDESFYAERTIKAGAMGYLTKEEAIDRVIDGIRSVQRGRIFLSDHMAQFMLSRMATKPSAAAVSGIDSLSDRELEVLRLIGQGKSTRQIAELLHLSVKTIETHRENIKQKLKLKNASQLVQYAVRFSLESTG